MSQKELDPQLNREQRLEFTQRRLAREMMRTNQRARRVLKSEDGTLFLLATDPESGWIRHWALRENTASVKGSTIKYLQSFINQEGLAELVACVVNPSLRGLALEVPQTNLGKLLKREGIRVESGPNIEFYIEKLIAGMQRSIDHMSNQKSVRGWNQGSVEINK